MYKESNPTTLLEKKIRCEIYSRVCGFYRPISQFNKGKKEEYQQRKLLHSTAQQILPCPLSFCLEQ